MIQIGKRIPLDAGKLPFAQLCAKPVGSNRRILGIQQSREQRQQGTACHLYSLDQNVVQILHGDTDIDDVRHDHRDDELEARFDDDKEDRQYKGRTVRAHAGKDHLQFSHKATSF